MMCPGVPGRSPGDIGGPRQVLLTTPEKGEPDDVGEP